MIFVIFQAKIVRWFYLFEAHLSDFFLVNQGGKRSVEKNQAMWRKFEVEGNKLNQKNIVFS